MAALASAGFVSAVGSDWPASCAAIRARIQGFAESAFLDGRGKPVVIASAREAVPQKSGLPLLAAIAAQAIAECLGDLPLHRTPLLCAVSRADRPGRPPGIAALLPRIERSLGAEMHSDSRLFEAGEVGALLALDAGRDLLRRDRADCCLICGVDSLVNADALHFLESTGRLKSEANPDGLIPGEAAACVMLVPEGRDNCAALQIRGIGFGQEAAMMGGADPVLGLGLAAAMKSAFADGAMTTEDVDYRLTDATGERYWFADATYGMSRVFRVRKPYFEMWNISDSIGHTGAAAGASMLAYLLYVFQNGLSPHAGVMLHNSCPTGERAAVVAVGDVRSRAYGE